MSLKSTFFSGALGTAGTTSIAIPSAGAYSNAYAESERQTLEKAKKEAEEVNTELKGINANLNQQKEAADKAKDNAEKEKQNTQHQLDHQKTRYDALKKKKDEIIAAKAQVRTQLASLQSDRNQWESEKNSKLARLKELEKQKEDLIKKQAEHSTKLQEAHRQMDEKVVNSIKDGLNNPDKLENEYLKERWYIHKFLNDKIPSLQPLHKEDSHAWNCKKHVWGTLESAKEGIAYCVLSPIKS